MRLAPVSVSREPTGSPMRLASLLTILWMGLALLGGAASAGPGVTLYDLWLAPARYMVGVGEPVVADLFRGTGFEGYPVGVSITGLHRFEILSGEARTGIETAPGTRPAVQEAAPHEGLAILVHESAGAVAAWPEWSDFEHFARAGDFAWALEDHRDRGLPGTGFRMACVHYAKALVAVGTGEGKDHPVGLEAEIVALANPYTDDLSAGIPVRVLYQGKPRRSLRMMLDLRFPDGTLSERVGWSDVDGVLRLPHEPGAEYLVKAVVLRPLAGNGGGIDPVWETLWTTLSFRAPG